jgi:macrolide transport system ATP-binding/permease protein
LPYFQEFSRSEMTFELRTQSQPASLGESIRRTVQELDPKVQVLRLQTMNDVVDESLIQERFVAQLASFFGLFALLLATMGLYGLMSYAVTRRTKEIGIRIALGARVPDLIRMVFRESMSMVVIGMIIGLCAALGCTHFVSSFLYVLSPTDPITISLAVLVMLCVASLASYLPARRASQMNPTIALRVE